MNVRVEKIVTNITDRREDNGYMIVIKLKGYGRKDEAFAMKEKIQKFVDEEFVD